ncbi:hypothetical+protein [Methylocapsa aurea]|uniref:hypothetical protein n=1 Tax=Methylocapsa aurea TaxID=663610 RepID=UPI003D18B292
MTDENSAGQKLDKLLSALDSITQRMDAMEQREAAATKQRRADSRKRKDSVADAPGVVPKSAGDPDDPYRKIDEPKQLAADDEGNANMSDDLPEKMRRAKALRDELNALERQVSREMREQGPLIEAEESAMADYQARADETYAALGKRAPAPLPGERLRQYRGRLLKPLQQYSETWRHVALGEQPDKNLQVIEKQIFADAVAYADSGSHLAPDETHAISKKDDSGRTITEFKGASFVRQFKRPKQYARLNDPQAHRLRELLSRGGI